MESKKQLKEKIAELEKTVKSKDKEIQTLRLQLSGKHICTNYCVACEHSIFSAHETPKGIEFYLCVLEATCKDFKHR